MDGGVSVVSEFFLKKINSEDFKSNLNNILTELSGKKVLIYGAGVAFAYFYENKYFDKLDIVAIMDKKFEKACEKKPENYFNFKLITPEEAKNETYDFVLITNESSSHLVTFLKNFITIDIAKIKTIFDEEFLEESKNYNYLAKMEFEKHFEKLKKKLKNKKIIIYGTGLLFQAIQKYYNLEELNIIGVSDSKYSCASENECAFGYKAIAPAKIKEHNPDYVLVATKLYVSLIDNLENNLFKKTKIKVRPIVHKPLKVLIKEIWK